ncbi:MAG TPA: nitrogenase molybdenum-iron protein subunit beta [Methylomusa anaerophila]|uniref:Nitrogenase molybdenum-iron protein beta chain n=1 Tax=Methylomusa anaerophila TaxID=1930071 RepID=A0A348ALT1_9FIRM|nr:nitrogenase molybdenum-iron protein subunit beta [Methylomusa anaerophila]BBB92029.1 nitrogenase molybdenum-iron protein beta chain [Methylomusa anaerophila]HML87960.1 nitrogenase molybdenum-iron protein subunit beta [Methylomusa anaerophila]
MSTANNCAQSVQSVLDWMATEEYKEKNFAREALVINPARTCQPFGAMLCALGIEGCLPFLHGSQGCAAYFRSCLTRHVREPVPMVSDSMTEDAAVFGGQANLIEGLKNAYATYKPSIIGMFSSCMAEVIGDDMKSFIGNARNQGAIPEDFPIAYANTPSFVGSHITGFDNMLKGLLQSLADTRHGKWTNGRLYVVPGFDLYPANLREYRRLITAMGIYMTVLPDFTEALDSPNTGEYKMYQPGTSMAELADALNASGFIFLQKYSTAGTQKFVKNVQKITSEAVTMPVGIRNTDAFLMTLQAMTGKSIPAEIEKERGRAVDAAIDAHQYIHGKRFALYGDPDLLLGLVGFLLDMGGIPVHILCSNGNEPFRKEMEALLASSSFGSEGRVYNGKDLWHLRSLLLTEPVDMLIGDTHGKTVAKDANIPLARIGYYLPDRVHLHRQPIVGYQGAINLITMIANLFIDEYDRNCPEERFEFLR